MGIWNDVFFGVETFYLDTVISFATSLLHYEVGVELGGFVVSSRYWTWQTAAPGCGKSPAWKFVPQVSIEEFLWRIKWITGNSLNRNVWRISFSEVVFFNGFLVLNVDYFEFDLLSRWFTMFRHSAPFPLDYYVITYYYPLPFFSLLTIQLLFIYHSSTTYGHSS